MCRKQDKTAAESTFAHSIKSKTVIATNRNLLFYECERVVTEKKNHLALCLCFSSVCDRVHSLNKASTKRSTFLFFFFFASSLLSNACGFLSICLFANKLYCWFVLCVRLDRSTSGICNFVRFRFCMSMFASFSLSACVLCDFFFGSDLKRSEWADI